VILTQIARAQGLQRKFDEAKATLDEVSKELSTLESEIDSSNSTTVEELAKEIRVRQVRVRYLIENGRVLNSSGDSEASIKPFRMAVQISRIEPKDDDMEYLEVDALHMLAIAEKDESEKIRRSEMAIKVAEKSDAAPKTKKWLGSLLNNLAWIHMDAQRYDVALAVFEKAVKAREEQWRLALAEGGDKNEAAIAALRISRWSVARAMRSLGKVEEAIEIQEDLMEQYKSPMDKGYGYEELALLYDAKGDKEKAKENAVKAFEELSKDSGFVEKEKERLEKLVQMAGL
jgi:tetratricopeptide (TPR) repeat protein